MHIHLDDLSFLMLHSDKTDVIMLGSIDNTIGAVTYLVQQRHIFIMIKSMELRWWQWAATEVEGMSKIWKCLFVLLYLWYAILLIKIANFQMLERKELWTFCWCIHYLHNDSTK